ncbi:hypothetical protein Tco_1140071 [Tanacetum coccineum]
MSLDVPRYLFQGGRVGDITGGDNDGVGVSQELLYLLRNDDGDRAIASVNLTDGKRESDGEEVLVLDASMGSNSSSMYRVSEV